MGNHRGPTRATRDSWRFLCDLVFSEEFRRRTITTCEAMGLTPGLTKALMSMKPGDPMPMKGLASAWHCDASYVTSLIDALEERDIVERRPHPTDRRAKTVVLTPQGERLKDELMTRLHEPPSFFNVLTTAEQELLRDLLAKVVAAGRDAPVLSHPGLVDHRH